MGDRENLQKQAQEKLAEARRLINEAGQLAKEGVFTLSFGEIGSYTPKAMTELEYYREEAEKIAREHGKYDGRTGKCVPWDQLSEQDRTALVTECMDELRSEALPYEARDYGYGYIADKWWHPSRC